ncbi:CRE-NHR-71 protein [Caenorhabditis remanei]|uniref:CRE-NHR-71 protein n=1 Tax=Caenorhabditis remanei TaxID=31234 RepID=E3ME31_CAERE|nr:CRE-NHR-71 protein [Caenorhabditis remanei]
MKDDYNSQDCMVCSAPADGLHYGAISCRSCNAFFRRTVVEKAEYRCKHTNTCVIDPDGRCACRSCRFSKCIEAGMKVSAVQPRRDPTGSQKERRKRAAGDANSMTGSPQERSSNSFSSDVPTPTSSYLVDAIKSDYGFATPRRVSTDYVNSPSDRYRKHVKIEIDDEPLPSTSSAPDKLSRQCTPTDDQQQEFNHLVFAYGEHQRMMQLSFSTFEQFLDEHSTGPKLRRMDPLDVSKLSAVELTGLLYWIEKQQPYGELPNEDKSSLLKRYSVRKLSLDHFYSASKHPEYCARGEFVMNNFTFVPADRTGFELPDDDAHQIQAKRETFAPTFNRFWSNVIHPFVSMKVNDAEVVFLHIMLLWSVTNNEHVTENTRTVMKHRRDWAMNRLFEWYNDHNTEDPALRLGQMILLLGEIELICDMHCQDFQVAKLFEFCDMSKFWYETLCYAPCNTNVLKFDPNLLENLKRFTAISVMEANGALNSLIKTEIKSDPGMYSSPEMQDSPTQYIENHTIDLTNGFLPLPIHPPVPPPKSPDAVDPDLLVYNAHLIPCVLAPLPDDVHMNMEIPSAHTAPVSAPAPAPISVSVTLPPPPAPITLPITLPISLPVPVPILNKRNLEIRL